MAKTFGEFLKKRRITATPKKLSQQQLGDVIGSTRQYIDAIEKNKGKTTPPRYNLLVKLIEKLQLNPDQQHRFLWMAFKERIQSNWELYTKLHPTPVQPTFTANSHSALTYAIRLTPQTGSLTASQQDDINRHISQSFTDTQRVSLSTTAVGVSVILNLGIEDALPPIIAKLKGNQIAWSPDVAVVTIGNIPAEWTQFSVAKIQHHTANTTH
jgi:transcriptional regulator with XRE-family HTH domain